MLGALVLIGGAILIFSTLSLLGWAISKYNWFQSAKQDIENQWGNIKAEYQRRFDLFMNLAETVKSFKKHEKNTLTDVTKARSQLNILSGAGESIDKQIKSMGSLDKFFSRLNMVFEKYPELKSDKHHSELMNEVRISEDRINVARTSFNELVNEYNTVLKTFPSNFIAGMFHFKIVDYYINEEASNKAPKISLD